MNTITPTVNQPVKSLNNSPKTSIGTTSLNTFRLLYYHFSIKGISINCLCPLRDLKRVAARREPQQNGHSILKARNAADACFRSRPAGLYGQRAQAINRGALKPVYTDTLKQIYYCILDSAAPSTATDVIRQHRAMTITCMNAAVEPSWMVSRYDIASYSRFSCLKSKHV